MMIKSIRTLVVLLISSSFIWPFFISPHADASEPLAVRKWPGGTISLEAMSGLMLVIQAGDDAQQIAGDKTIKMDQSFDHRLWFDAKTDDVQWQPAGQPFVSNFGSISVRSITADSANVGLAIDVEGILVVVIPTGRTIQNDDLRDAAVLVLMVQQPNSLVDPATIQTVNALKPATILVNPTEPLSDDSIEQFRTRLNIKSETKSVPHNTLAIAANDEHGLTNLVLLGESQWKMNDEMSELFQAMDKSRQASQAVFAALSTEQLNFRPANGTHTPRWNTEHMMGRELLFFSQIFHAIDPTIPIVDLNPKQMPPDYRAAHPDWNGLQEARQTENVGKFTRRFAYLLNGIEMDQKAPGSSWSLRGLIRQMAKHYNEHTANTVKKFQ